MHVKLKILRGASAGKEVAIKGPRFFIGRADECHLRANSDAISRRHCAITVQKDGSVSIRDLGSRNGTFVNGVRIDGEHRVAMGDQLRVGPLEFLVTYLKSAAAAAQKPKPVDAKAISDDDIAGLIDGWLSEGNDATGTARPAGETREFRLDETDRIQVPGSSNGKNREDDNGAKGKEASSTDRAKSNSDPPAGENVDEKKGERAPVLPTGRRGGPKQVPKDTQEAAAQTLRKFFNRGG